MSREDASSKHSAFAERDFVATPSTGKGLTPILLCALCVLCGKRFAVAFRYNE